MYCGAFLWGLHWSYSQPRIFSDAQQAEADALAHPDAGKPPKRENALNATPPELTGLEVGSTKITLDTPFFGKSKSATSPQLRS